MGRSGPQITAKRQLWDCVTLTMVLLSLLFRPGKWCFFFLQSVLLHSSPACKAAVPLSFGIEVEKKSKLFPGAVWPNSICLTALSVSRTRLLKCFNGLVLKMGRKKSMLFKSNAVHYGDKVKSCCCGVSQPPACTATRVSLLAEQHEFTRFYGRLFKLIPNNSRVKRRQTSRHQMLNSRHVSRN